MNHDMSPDLEKRIDQKRYPSELVCQFCGGTKGHSEEVWTGDDGSPDSSGYELWFCCHDCRDAGQPCETFFPISLTPEVQA